MFTKPRMTSTTLTSNARARSPTMIVFGRATTVPVSATATRTSSRLGRVVRQATQVRCGRVRAALPPEDPPARGAGGRAPRLLVPLGALLFASEERTVLFIQVLLVRLGRFGLDLGDEVMPDLRFLLRRSGLGHRNRFGLGFGFDLGADLGLAPDVDPPAGQLGRKPRILAFLADRQRELAVGHDYVCGLLLGHDVDAHHVRRFKGVRHETLGALGPLDDVDLFAAELVHDRLDAQSALADAGASRVEAGLTGAHGDLRAGAGLAGDADDLDLPVEDLRDFELEESLHERLV